MSGPSVLVKAKQHKSIMSIILISVLMLLLFYPPYFRGLFFSPEMLLTQITTGLLLAVVLGMKMRRRDLAFLAHPLDFTVLAYALAYTLSVFVAVSLPDAIRGMLKAIDYLAIYWLIIELVKTRTQIRLALNVLYLSAVGVAIVSIAVAAGYMQYPGVVFQGRIYSTLQYPNIAAAYLAATSLLGFTIWQGQTKLYGRLAYAIGNFLLILVSLAGLSKGGWLILGGGLVLLLLGLTFAQWPRLIFNAALSVGAAVAALRGLMVTAQQGNSQELWPALFIGVAIVVIGELLATGGEKLHAKYAKGRVPVKFAAIALMIILIGAAGFTVSKQDVIERILPASFVARLATFDTEGSSFVTRFDYSVTAWEIVKDYPLLGTGAGGWNALYHQYMDYLAYTTEVHNHFMQVWVEAGTGGFIAFLTMWAMLVYTLWQIRCMSVSRSDWLLVWGGGAAALALGAHSAIDFTFSLPSVCILLWSLLALVRTEHSMILAERKINYNILPRKRQFPVGLITGLLAGLILLIPSSSFYAAEYSAGVGATAIQKAYMSQAATAFERAVRLDPFTASYRADFAQAACYANLSKKDRNVGERVIRELEKAERLEPNNIKLQSKLLNLYATVGRGDKTLVVADRLTQLNPLSIDTYETLGRVYISASSYFLERKDEKTAQPYLNRIYNLPNEVQSKADSIPKDKLVFWVGQPLEVTPEVKLLVGQAAYLKGDYLEAKRHLEETATVKTELRRQVTPWLAATYKALGEDNQAGQLLNEITDSKTESEKEYNRLVNLKGR